MRKRLQGGINHKFKNKDVLNEELLYSVADQKHMRGGAIYCIYGDNLLMDFYCNYI